MLITLFPCAIVALIPMIQTQAADTAQQRQQAVAPPTEGVSMRNWQRLTSFVNAYANYSPDDKTVAYQSNANGNWDLFEMDADGGNVRRLVDHPAADITPVYSPDGQRLAFVSERDGQREVYVIDINGSNLSRITNEAGHDIHPVWSTDGSRIMFSSNRGNENPDDYDIYVMNADGSNLVQVTDGPDIDTYASWSPDERLIVTRRVIDQGRNNEVFVLNADGSNPRNLTNNPANYDGWPVWSPDGRRIAFASGDSSQQRHYIYWIRPDGTGLAQLTTAPPGQTFCYNTQPCFSRDGRRLVFTMYRPGPRESAELCAIDVPEQD